MLNSIQVKNFKSIKGAELEFGLVNLFIGSNGSGKSNILEAIGVLSAAFGRGISPQDLDYKGVRLSLPRLFKSTFKNRKIPKSFGLVAKLGAIEYSVNITAGEQSATLHYQTERLNEDGKMVLGRGPHGAKIHLPSREGPELKEAVSLNNDRGVFDSLGAFSQISKVSAADITAFSRYAVYTPQTAVMRGVTPDTRPIEPLGLTGGRMAAALSEVLSQRKSTNDINVRVRLDKILEIVWKPGWANMLQTGQFDPNIVPSHIGDAQDMIYVRDRYMKTGRNYLSPYDASEGTLYLVFVATLLAHNHAPKYFGLDNVDGTLNPGLVRKLMDHIVEVICEKEDDVEHSGPHQVFLTSHNPTALDALDIFDSSHKIFIVRRNEQDGGTEFLPLLPPEGMDKSDWIQRSEGKNLSRMWLDERFPDALG